MTGIFEGLLGLAWVVIVLISFEVYRIRRAYKRLLGRFTALNFSEAELERLIGKGGE